jgi:hypothetical protein
METILFNEIYKSKFETFSMLFVSIDRDVIDPMGITYFGSLITNLGSGSLSVNVIVGLIYISVAL